jgi:phage baseplate assembly protein W
MPDVSQLWGDDLSLNPTGDLGLASGSALGQQRVLRRLLTNQGEYIWQPTYGAGLAQFIGGPINALQIRAVIRSQIFKESSVARNPEPVIDVVSSGDGTVYVHVRYVDSASGQTQTLSFSVSG